MITTKELNDYMLFHELLPTIRRLDYAHLLPRAVMDSALTRLQLNSHGTCHIHRLWYHPPEGSVLYCIRSPFTPTGRPTARESRSSQTRDIFDGTTSTLAPSMPARALQG